MFLQVLGTLMIIIFKLMFGAITYRSIDCFLLWAEDFIVNVDLLLVLLSIHMFHYLINI